MLTEPLDSVLGTKNRLRLLRVLAFLDRPVSGREAARLAGVSRIAQQSLDELSDAGILNRMATASQYLYQFNHENYLASALIGLFEAERARLSALMDQFAEVLCRTGDAVSASIFGSMARGEAGPGSDLDLLVLVERRSSKEPIKSALVDAAAGFENEFGLRISPVVLTTSEARQQMRDGDSFLGSVVHEGRAVFGDPLDEVLHG